MLKRLHGKVKALERRLNTPVTGDLSDPEVRRRLTWHFHLMDHAFLRTFWTNFHEVAPGVYRSNQPGPARLKRYHDLGIRTVLNLRGSAQLSYYLFERETCRRLGMEMVDVNLSARTLAPPEVILRLVELFRTLPRPLVMHCKSGADRTGFAAALYLMLIEGRPVEEAMRQLDWRYVHRSTTDTGVLDHFFRFYAREQRRTGIGLLDWIREGYDRETVTASFRAWQAGRWDPE